MPEAVRKWTLMLCHWLQLTGVVEECVYKWRQQRAVWCSRWQRGVCHHLCLECSNHFLGQMAVNQMSPNPIFQLWLLISTLELQIYWWISVLIYQTETSPVKCSKLNSSSQPLPLAVPQASHPWDADPESFSFSLSNPSPWLYLPPPSSFSSTSHFIGSHKFRTRALWGLPSLPTSLVLISGFSWIT